MTSPEGLQQHISLIHWHYKYTWTIWHVSCATYLTPRLPKCITYVEDWFTDPTHHHQAVSILLYAHLIADYWVVNYNKTCIVIFWDEHLSLLLIKCLTCAQLALWKQLSPAHLSPQCIALEISVAVLIYSCRTLTYCNKTVVLAVCIIKIKIQLSIP